MRGICRDRKPKTAYLHSVKLGQNEIVAQLSIQLLLLAIFKKMGL